MINTSGLTDLEHRARWALHGASDQDLDELAHLALTLHMIHNIHVSPQGRRAMDDCLAVVAPEFLLALRALDQLAQRITQSPKED